MPTTRTAGSPSERLHDCLRSVSSANVSSSEKGGILQSLRCMLESSSSSSSPLLHSSTILNAYMFLPASDSSGIRLPAWHDFNKQLKRGYAILIWIRPFVAAIASETKPSSDTAPQTLFRLATFDNRTFIQCTLSQWTHHNANDNEDSNPHASAKIILSIGGTAMPAVQPPGSRSSTREQQSDQHSQLLPIHVASATLTFSTTDWQLLTISHSNPYLKRPRITITISGTVVLDAECPYPVVNPPSLESSLFSPSSSTSSMLDMEEILLLHNLQIPILCGSCAVLQEPFLSTEPIAVLAELGPSSDKSIIAHPPPVPLNRDAAPVSVVTAPHSYSLGMTDSLSGRGETSQQQPRTPVLSGSSNIEYSSRIGIPSCKEGNRGAEIIQLLRSKIIYEFHPWDAPTNRSHQQRVIIPPTFVCAKLGVTENVRLGLVEPNPGSFHVLTTTANNIMQSHTSSTLSGLVLLGAGTILRNSDYVKQQLPQDSLLLPIVSVSTHVAVHSLSLLIMPFRLALPSLGENNYDDIQQKKQYEQALLKTLMENNGFVVGEICHLIATLLRSNGEIREEAVQSGFLYSLSSLIRRVIRRGYWSGMLSTISNTTSFNNNTNSDSPPPIYPLPTPVVHGALDIVSACCGGVYKYSNKRQTQKQPNRSNTVVVGKDRHAIPPCLFIRRTSDLALQCLFGFCFQGVLWGASTNSDFKSNSNWKAAAAMLRAITYRYCPSKILCVTQNPYGEFLRNHMTVQTLLDTIQWFYVLPSTDQNKPDILSCSDSFTTLLFHLLHASLSADGTEVGASRSEQDVQACVSALTSTSLNSFVSDIILKALHGILANCTTNIPALNWYAYPDFTAELSREETMFTVSTSNADTKTAKNRDVVSNKLARHLSAANAGSIVFPMLLSRMVNFGVTTATASPTSSSNKIIAASSPIEPAKFSTVIPNNQENNLMDWKVQWRRTLLLWLWLLNSLPNFPSTSLNSNSALFEKSLKRSCALLLACAKTGALDCCVSMEIVDRLLPIAGCEDETNASDAAIKGGTACVSMERLKLILPLVPALVVSLLPTTSSTASQSQDNHNATFSCYSENFGAALLYKLVHSLQYSIQAALRLALLQLVRHSSTGGRVSSSSPTYGGSFYGGWTSLSLTSPGKRLLLFSQHCVESLTQTLFLVQPHTQSISNNDGLVSCKKMSGAFNFCNTSSSMHELLSAAPEDLFQGAYEIIQGLLASVLCVVMQNVSTGHSGGCIQPNIVIWKSVLSAMPTADPIRREGQLLTTNMDDGYPAIFLCELISETIEQLCVLSEGTTFNSAGNRNNTDSSVSAIERPSKQGPWSKNVCNSFARIATMIQEKNLLRPSESIPVYFVHSQLKLMRQVLHVLKVGREQMGWCQLTAFMHTSLPLASTAVSSSVAASIDTYASNKKLESAGYSGGGFNLPKVRITPASAPSHNSDAGAHQDVIAPPAGFEETSKQCQPFLRPFLNFAMQSLGFIPETSANLWELIMDELKATITAALVGLTFPCARDVGIGALCATRWALKKLDDDGNSLGQCVCMRLILVIVEELRERHVNEKRVRANTDEDASRAFVEQMIFGNHPFAAVQSANKSDEPMRKSRITKAESPLRIKAEDALMPQAAVGLNFQRPADKLTDDFIMYSDALTPEATDLSKLPEILERSGTSQLSYSSYAGLFSALERCRDKTITNDLDNNSDACSGEQGVNLEGNQRLNAIDSLTILASYLDLWDEHIQRESTFDIVGLFEMCSIDSVENTNTFQSDESLTKEFWDIRNHTTSSLSPYANTVAQFIELATGERLRLTDSRNALLHSIVHSSDVAAEHYMYRYMMDAARDTSDVIPELISERAIGDSGKDVYSRLASYPIHRQFPRYVPAYLDHGANTPLSVSSSSGVATNAILEQDILKVAAQVKIVDITKSVAIDECEQDRPGGTKEVEPATDNQTDQIKADSDESDDLDLGFVDRSSFMNRSCAEADRDSQNNIKIDVSKANQHPADGKAPESLQPFETGNLTTWQQEEAGPFFDASTCQGGPVLSTTTSFALPPTASHGTGLPVECYFGNVLHVRAEGSRRASLLITGFHLILEYETEIFEGEEPVVREDDRPNDDENSNKNAANVVALRPKLMRWAIVEISQIFLRRYRLRDSALEVFLIPSGGSEGAFPSVSIFVDFGPGYAGNSRRDAAGTALMKRAPSQSIKQWPERSSYFVHEHRQRLTSAWVDGRLSNFDYLLHLNTLAGRTFNDLCQYPVMPWVLSNYTSEETPDLLDRKNFRDLSLPMGALNSSRLEDFMERFETFQDPTIPPFMYGSHYSTNAGVVLHFLVRLHPFAGLHRQLQNGHFDVADRLFSSVPRTWEGCTGSSAAEVKELTPEWYCCPTFLRNVNNFKLGTSQDGVVIDDVVLPPWAKNNPERFIEVMRAALESDICSEMLPDWIDLIFGYKQQGPEAVKANNVFFYLTYYGSVDVASIEDESLRMATELQIAHFGQCPMQLFWRPHPRKQFRSQKVGFAEFGFHENLLFKSTESPAHIPEEGLYPFLSAPPSHVINLDAPPPKSNASLIAVRLVGVDRILTVDSHGIFHCFRYSWKADPRNAKDDVVFFNDESTLLAQKSAPDQSFDQGCFVAQRELPHFRSVPRLPHVPLSKRKRIAVALSKTLFASRTLLLALSDGDGRGGLAMQFIDPAKGLVKGESIVPCVHSEQVTAIAMDPLGVATGGGAGGELAIIGSADGSASLWRFISSHYLPLRPRQRMRGHNGSAIHAVAINSTLNVCATVSSHRCCIFSLGNGVLLCNISPPKDACPDVSLEFAEASAACFSILGYIILVCKSIVKQKPTKVEVDDSCRLPVNAGEVFSLQLFSLEGVHCGSHVLEISVPHKIIATFDGRAVLVSCDGGVSVHLVSPTTPLKILSKWVIKEGDGTNIPTLDIDIGPSLFRPVVAAAACSEGALRLHALPGISSWSEANKKGSMSTVVGNALAKPAEKLKQAGGIVKGIGSSIVGLGRELGREAMSDVKEKGVAGFLGGVFGRR